MPFFAPSNFGQCLLQYAWKVVSDSPGLVDFAIWPVNSALNLLDGQVKFSGKKRTLRTLINPVNPVHQKSFLG